MLFRDAIMKIRNILCYMTLILLSLLLVACGGESSSDVQATASPTAVRVNGFGTAANHVHSMLALPNHVLVLATHYGLFRSADDGTTWQEVAGGPHQLMDGLMTYSLQVSPLDSNRLYVLTLPSVTPHAGTPGLYTSADQGRTWTLSIPTASLTSSSIFMVEPGNDTPNEVYIYLPDLGPLGLQLSLDAGQHFPAQGCCHLGAFLVFWLFLGHRGSF